MAGLLNVGVVPRPPLNRRQRRIRSEPLAARRRGAGAHRSVLRPVTHDLVEAADGIVRVRDEEHVVRHPPVVEPVGPHARYASPGHLHDFGLGQQPPLVDRDRIDLLVVRPGTGRCVEIRRCLVEVVHDRRLPIQECFRHIPGEREILPHPVPVVVVCDVLAPGTSTAGANHPAPASC